MDETVKESLDEIKAIREGLKKDFQKIKEDYFVISPEVQLQQMTKAESNSIEAIRYCSDVL